MSTRTALKQRYRIGAAAAAIILPLALTGCGSDDEPASSGSSTTGTTTGSTTGTDGGDDALGSIKKGVDGLEAAKSASFELSFDDSDGKLATAFTEDSPEDKEIADIVLGSTIKVTVDPAGDATLGSLGSFDSTKGISTQLKAANFSVAVNSDGGDIVGIRLVDGVLYANVDLKKIDELAKKGGESGGILNDITAFSASAPPQAAAAIKDAQAGKWLKLDLSPLAEQFGGLLKGAVPTATASAAADSAKLVESLKTAVLSNTTATGSDGDYDVEIKAKDALTAIVSALKASGLPGVDMFSAADLEGIGAGTLKGNVKVDGDSIKELSVDLQSFNALLPVDEQAKAGLDGSSIKLVFDDSADEVSAPDNVSSVDLNALLATFIGQFAGAFGGAGAGTTTG